MERIPIKVINENHKAQKRLRDDIITMVEVMLKLNKQRNSNIELEQIDQLNQRIEYTDEKINKLVYELYELSDEEIRIVEGK
jgi:hypothetical protein